MSYKLRLVATKILPVKTATAIGIKYQLELRLLRMKIIFFMLVICTPSCDSSS